MIGRNLELNQEETEMKTVGDAGEWHPQNPEDEPIRPFRLVKYFSLTGFVVILIFTLVLTIFISRQARNMILKKSDDYALLLADNLNHQVFLQFVIPTAVRYGRIRLRDPYQFNLLDAVVRNTIHSFKVKRVNIYDLEGKVIYSTDKDQLNKEAVDEKAYQDALEGKNSSILISKSGQSLPGLGQSWTLKTLFPFRGEKPVKGAVGDILGVFEIYQDLTEDYAENTRFQYLSIAISLGFSGVLFFILRQILIRGERIIDERNEEQRRLEEKLHHSERLAALGRMIAAVAHEIRNPLGIISSTGEILRGKIKKYEPDNKLADVIVEESGRLNGIVTEFLDFARPQTPNMNPCRIEDVLDKNLGFLSPALDKDGIDVEKDYQGPDSISADSDLLYRAFLNVFMNAVQSMPEGGRLKVSTSLPYDKNGKSLGIVEVVVADTGTGIDPEKAETLFNPFVTTKNRGSGLGLAIVKNIIESHKGQVAMESNKGGGTRLIVRLPVSQN